jgi:GT2 family glycosyltransferase
MAQHPECAACQPKIRSEYEPEKFEYAGAAGGFIDSYGYPFCRGRVMNNIETDNGQYDSIQEIFWATGACLVIRSKAYWEAGGLDGRFFAHQEEIDLCWRLKARGASIVCVPQSEVYHVGGGSLGYESPFKTRLNFRNNAILLYKNLSADRYWWTYLFRLALDWVAALQMLAQGKPRNAWAVIEAQIEFIKLFKQFKPDRTKNLDLTTEKNPIGLLNFWLIWQVYINKKKKYSDF